MRDRIEQLTDAFLADMRRLIAEAVVEGIKRDTRPTVRRVGPVAAAVLKQMRQRHSLAGESELTVPQAAEALGLKKGTVYQLITRGLLKGRKQGKTRLLTREQVEALARERGT